MANTVTSFMVQGQKYGVDPDLQFDSTPTQGSNNPVTSNGILNAVQGATLGTNISVGRTPGTDVGEYSVAYGDNNTAIGTSSIVYGSNNVCSTPMSIISGDNNLSICGENNVVMGRNNKILGLGSAVFGQENTLGSPPIYGGSVNNSTPSVANAYIYIGYVNTSGKVIFYTPDRSGTPIPENPLSLGGTCLYVDVETKKLYVKTRTGSGQEPRNYTLSEVQKPDLTNRSFSINYLFGGFCYWDQANNVNYTDSSKSKRINGDVNQPYIYFDLSSNGFLIYTSAWIFDSAYIVGTKNTWLPVKAYFGRRSSTPYSISAYIRDGGKYPVASDFNVFKSSAFSSEENLTSTILDGELVYNMSGISTPDDANLDASNKVFMYIRDANNTLVYAYNLTKNGTGGVAAACGYSTANCSIVAGTGNKCSGNVSTIFGGNNTVNGVGYGLLMAGSENKIDMPNASGNANILMVGRSNLISSAYGTENESINGSCMIGSSHSAYVSGGLEYVNVFGMSNHIYNLGLSYYGTTDAYQIFAWGRENYMYNAYETSVFGDTNKVFNPKHCNIIGDFNNVGFPYNMPTVYSATFGSNGIYSGPGIEYDETTNKYTLNTDYIWTIKDHIGNIISLMYSPDGSNFAQVTENAEWNGSFISGNNNVVCGADTFGFQSSASGVHVLGYSNYVRLFNGSYDAINGVSVIGNFLKVEYTSTGSVGHDVNGAMYVGSCNDEHHHGNLQFSVGIGPNENDRKDGFRVYRNGMNYAPSAPKTLADIKAAAEANGMDEDSIVITYGMLKSILGL